jgi:hypothetical protein
MILACHLCLCRTLCCSSSSSSRSSSTRQRRPCASATTTRRCCTLRTGCHISYRTGGSLYVALATAHPTTPKRRSCRRCCCWYLSLRCRRHSRRLYASAQCWQYGQWLTRLQWWQDCGTAVSGGGQWLKKSTGRKALRYSCWRAVRLVDHETL